MPNLETTRATISLQDIVIDLGANPGKLAPHILSAIPGTPYSCPIAQYIKAQNPEYKEVEVNGKYVQTFFPTHYYKIAASLPLNLRNFISKFDAGWAQRLHNDEDLG